MPSVMETNARAMLSMESQRIVADTSLEGEGATSKSALGRQEPRGRNERFLTLFAVATVATLPAVALIGLGYYLEMQTVVFVGVILFIIASVLWLVSYLTVASWIVSDVRYFIGEFLKFAFKSSAKRNPPQ